MVLAYQTDRPPKSTGGLPTPTGVGVPRRDPEVAAAEPSRRGDTPTYNPTRPFPAIDRMTIAITPAGPTRPLGTTPQDRQNPP
jgi:hypothetical protein